MFDSFNVEAIFAIIVIDLVLSGDNAVVIGMAARRLSPENRRKAILFGGLGAVVLRVAFTAVAAILLDTPYLQLIGGLLLLYIAWKLLRPHTEHTGTVDSAASLGEAVRTIVLADVVMSLDNILAVGGAAHGDLGLLLFGLVLSIPILLLGSELVARALGRFPILLYLGVLVLIHTAITMIVEDDVVHARLPEGLVGWAAGWQLWVVALAITAIVTAAVTRGRRHVEDPAEELAEEVETIATGAPPADHGYGTHPTATSADSSRPAGRG